MPLFYIYIRWEAKNMLLRRYHKQNIKVEYANLSYNELRTLAKDKGVNTYKMSTDDIIEALNKVGE